ncbi:FecR family protein [Sphingobacterium faecium]|uniref:FecR family protein n=1 Tax=Sphingobacterium faecium TaxID=34087 RepID=UPI002469AFEA|nr:FecR domain-containing protein [Sphingobacterium faecium]MDH5826287.1 FecR domain-containing protein [Sphingobacterium faecium]
MQEPNPKFDKSIDKYLNGEASKEDTDAVEEFYESFSSRPDMLNKLTERRQRAIKARIRQNILKRLDLKEKKQISLTKIIAIAAIFCLVISYIWWPETGQLNNIEVALAKGQQRLIILEDGTKVTLNASSKIVYPTSFKDATNRQVTLIGEAYFDVAKDPNKPFLIHTPRMQISVLGTAFNVRDYAEESSAETALIHGKVSISQSGVKKQKYILTPKEKFVVSAMSSAHQKSISPSEIISSNNDVAIQKFDISDKDGSAIETEWMLNRMTIIDESLSEIAKKLERIYDVKINISNPSVAKQRYSATFDQEKLTNILKALQTVQHFNYTTKDKRFIEIK